MKQRKIFQNKAYEAVVEGSRQVFQVQPDIERRLGWDRDLETKAREALEDVITLVLEVSLKGDPLLEGMLRVKKRYGRKLQAEFIVKLGSERCVAYTYG
jgi:hypothetical protein